jgi:hypothetical protein
MERPADFDPHSTEPTEYTRAVTEEAQKKTFQRFLLANRIQYVVLGVFGVVLLIGFVVNALNGG